MSQDSCSSRLVHPRSALQARLDEGRPGAKITLRNGARIIETWPADDWG
jgi:hypothetical protein